MRFRDLTRVLTALVLLLSLPGALFAESLSIPAGTPIYAELYGDVTSKKKHTAAGDVIPARAYQDVVVDGEVVIAEGAEVILRVADVKKARFLGRKGRLMLEAVSVRAVDGSDVPLDGYQYRTGKGRKAVTAALSIAVAWPFLFLKGKNARAPAGTVLQAVVLDDVEVTQPVLVAAR